MGFVTVVTQVLIMFLLMGVGFAASKMNILSRPTAQDMTAILVTFVSPTLILKAFSAPFEAEKAQNLFVMASLFLLFMGFHILLGHFILLKDEKMESSDRIKQSRFAFAYANTGFMGIPLAMALFGSDGVFYGAVALSAQSIYLWTHGYALLGPKAIGNQALKIISNPNIVALVLGIAMYFSPYRPSETLSSLFSYISNLNTPMSMMVIGNSIANIYLGSVFTDKEVWKTAFLRNVVSPLIVIGLLTLLPAGLLNPLPAQVTVLIWACPVAANAVMFSKLGGRDESFPAKLVALSTLLSALTLPLMASLGSSFLAS